MGLLTACKSGQEPIQEGTSNTPAWVKGFEWDEINDKDFTLSEDGRTLLKWHNKNIVNLDMNRNARLKKVKTIGKEPFKGCDKLTAMILSDEVQTLEIECFDGTYNLERIHLGNVKTIKGQAFKGQRSLKELHLPKTLIELDEEFCRGCDNLQLLAIPDDNPKYKIVDNVLFDKDITTLICYPKGTPSKSYIIPDGVLRLGTIAFDECKSLQEIICPPSLVEIGEDSFYTDPYLEHHYTIQFLAKRVVAIKLRYPSDNPNPYDRLFNKRTRILVPHELVQQYKSDIAWGNTTIQIEAIQ